MAGKRTMMHDGDKKSLPLGFLTGQSDGVLNRFSWQA
jgi:hypothetical protein